MISIPQKSKLRFIAHNPTGELVRILTKEIKKGYGKRKEKIKE